MTQHRRTPRAKAARTATPDAVADDDLVDSLVAWLPEQRWFAGGVADTGRMKLHSRTAIPTDGSFALELVLLKDASAADTSVYQIFVGWRVQLPTSLAHAAIGQIGELHCYDALHDGAARALLLAGAERTVDLGTAITAVGPAAPPVIDEHHGLVMTVEQSNTSLVYGNELIMKFFRRLVPGINPDAEICAALNGHAYSAEYRGELRIVLDGQPTTLALMTGFIPNSADAWSMATASVRDLLAEGDLHPDEVGGDFATEAHRLGSVIAHVHVDLAAALGQHAADTDQIEHLVAGIRRDAAAVSSRVPELAELLPVIEKQCADLMDQSTAAPWDAQRIHGDLHLGQVLRTVDGWVVIDFEGEPSKPTAVRRAPQSPLKDVASMLRSLDYAARFPLYASTVNPQRAYRSDEWLARNRTAFLDGYAEVYGADPRDFPTRLAAFELAKAIYEVDYEQRHRPGWVKIPLDAIRALTEDQ